MSEEWLSVLQAVPAVMGVADSLFGGGGGSTAGAPQGYQPNWTGGADAAWQGAFGGQQGIHSQIQRQAQPAYQQSLQQAQGINYQPYLQGAQQAGQQYGALAGQAQGQAGIYGQQAALAGQQQAGLYGAADQLYQTGFDPQQALFHRSQQQLGEAVNAGQAQRGLGVSAIGGQEYNQAMGNFEMDWQNQQLARQEQAARGMGALSLAGGQQADLAGRGMAAQMGAGQQAAGFMGQAGQIPMQAQQYVAQQPAAAANQYGANMGALAGLYGGQMDAAAGYMGRGIGASQSNAAFGQAQQTFNAQQNAANMNLLTQAIGGPPQGGSQNPYGTGIYGAIQSQQAWGAPGSEAAAWQTGNWA